MLDIKQADNLKFRIRLFTYFINRELTKKAKEYGLILKEGQTVIDAMREDLENCTNLPIRNIYFKISEASNKMGENYQTEIIQQYSIIFLWILYRDTAYRDPFFWVISEVVNNPVFMEQLKPYVKPPDLWYCPNWNKSKKNTLDKKISGELGRFELSPEEKVFVPKFQREFQDNIIKQVEEKTKRYNQKT